MIQIPKSFPVYNRSKPALLKPKMDNIAIDFLDLGEAFCAAAWRFVGQFVVVVAGTVAIGCSIGIIYLICNFLSR